MSAKKIILISVLVVLVCGAIVGLTIYRSHAHELKVLSAKATIEDLSSTVSGTGQIKPLVYVNVGALVMGRVTHLYAREGDHVKQGEVVATIESIPQSSSVDAQKATISSSEKDIAADIAAEKVAQANIEHAEADLEQKKLDYQRAQELYKDALIAKQDFDSKKAAYDTDVATLAQDQASLVQANAETASARAKLSMNVATLRGDTDQLDRTISIAPFNGIVTNEPVREGESVVPGIQNTEGSTLMTLANMSVVTAEVKVDETDITNVAIGQPADVTVDALPGKVFKGHVTQVGDQALLRSTGIATSQSTSGTEEAKDFKVVVTLDNPSDELRPGLSTTAKITTAHKSNVLTIPIQALTLRVPPSANKPGVKKVDASLDTTKKQAPVQGVFVMRKEGRRIHAIFVPVQTGITGSTNIEVTGGLKAGDEIVIGPYRVLRTLKSGAQVKLDTTPVGALPSGDNGDGSSSS
ncbi:MAG TPA: efflux RND transporter periplasmic adaptor subunit [Acidobacteriaceae bacterium]|jgi:HlyD family secretion protein|nr:efflux RND transporter periplasmic adaptor subunit [Acidobacteriaceae bacterium]